MKHHIFEEASSYKVAVLIKHISFNKQELLNNYITPLMLQGIPNKDIIAFTLDYNDIGKVTAKFIKDYLAKLLIALNSLKVKYLYVADTSYFKVLVNKPKADSHIGYALPCKIKGFEHMTVVLGVNYQALIYNPELQSKLNRTLIALSSSVLGKYVDPGVGIIHSAWYPKDLTSIAVALESLHQYPSLTCDIEGFSLRFNKAGIGTIAFAWDLHHGVAFPCDYKKYEEKPDEGYEGYFQPNNEVRALLLEFFTTYKGELTFHSSTYDVKVIIYELWMQNPLDTKGLLTGLDIMTKRMHDTKIIAYLAINSTAGNTLGLKHLAHEFAGNWAAEIIKDIRYVPLDDLLRYNLVDALSTQYVRGKYETIMNRDNQGDLYRGLMLDSLKLIIQLELTGMPMSSKRIQEIKAQLEAIQHQHIAVIQNNSVIGVLNSLLQTAAMTAANAKLKVKQHPLTKFAHITFNPNSIPQLQQLLYEQMQLPVIDLTDTKMPATGAETVGKLIHRTDDPIYKALLAALIGYGKVTKILTTFIPAFEEAIRKNYSDTVWLHGSFNLGGTVSGRLSSCVAAWTLIRTQRGLVPITALQIGDLVWTHNRRWRPVTNIILKPITPMVDIRFCTGYTLTCTIAHKLRLPNGNWKTIEEILNERIKIVDAEPYEHTECSRGLPQQPTQNNHQNSHRFNNNNAQHQSCVTSKHACGRVESTTSIAILNSERRRTQSNEGQNRRAAPQLDRGMRGSQRLLDYPTQQHQTVRTSRSNGASSGSKGITKTLGSTSYRRESIEQCTRQSSSSNFSGAPHDTFIAGKNSFGEIETINYRGDLPVWDITVTDDHSYWAEGCFNHNSDPNLQNLPAKSEYGDLIKECFMAPDNWLMVGADFNALEDMVSALTTKDKNKLKVYIDGFDGHSLRAAYYFKDQCADIDPLDPISVNSIKKKYPGLRQDSKLPTFLLTYMGTHHGLMDQLGWSKERAKEVERGYHELYKESDAYIQKRVQQASKDGYATVAFGLRVRTPLLAQVIYGSPKMPHEAASEGRTVGNAMGQSYGLLNNRAAVDFMKKVWASKYRNDILPIGLIHDACYFVIKNSIELVEWVNKELILSMQWQDLPELYHDTVKLGANLDIYWPSWANAITLSNKATQEDIIELTKKGKADYELG